MEEGDAAQSKVKAGAEACNDSTLSLRVVVFAIKNEQNITQQVMRERARDEVVGTTSVLRSRQWSMCHHG